MRRAIAATELLLIFPAALFMTALFVRNLQPQPLEPAHTAQTIVMLYSSRPHIGLWVFLMALPFIVLMTGTLALVRNWTADAQLRQAARETVVAVRGHFATFLIACTTLASAVILAIVALHALSD